MATDMYMERAKSREKPTPEVTQKSLLNDINTTAPPTLYLGYNQSVLSLFV